MSHEAEYRPITSEFAWETWSRLAIFRVFYPVSDSPSLRLRSGFESRQPAGINSALRTLT